MIFRFLFVALNIIIFFVYTIFFNFYNFNYSNEKIKTIENANNDINIYFFKTHKTGSSTLKNILMRIMTKRKMTLVKNFQVQVDQNLSFNSKIFLDHKRFNLAEAEKLFPKNQSFI